MPEDMHQHGHSHHHGAWTAEQLKRLQHPDREQWMPRGPVMAAINAPFGGRVADVGAGLGWLTFPLAVAVGQSGRVLAIDPSEQGISSIRERADREGLSQIETLVAAAESTGLPDDYLDRIVWHTMYHDVHDRRKAIREMLRILKSGATWIIVDWEKEDTDMGPPQEVRMSPDEVTQEVTQAGFRVVDRWKAGPVTWGITAEKP